MATINFTVSDESLKEFFSTASKENPMKGIIEEILNQILEQRLTELCGAERYEQCEFRKDYRNGYRTRTMRSRFGKLTLKYPRTRNEPFSTELFKRYQRSDQAVILGCAEMLIQGVSTRSVQKVTDQLFGDQIPKSTVSEMAKILDPIVEEIRSRHLSPEYLAMFVDATYFRVREGARVVSKALYTAVGVNKKGTRELLGFALYNSETKESYKSFFESLQSRGMKKVDVVTSDNHAGLREAIRESWGNCSWQRCQAHFFRNCEEATPPRHWNQVREILNQILHATRIQDARKIKDQTMDILLTKAPKVAKLLDESFDDLTQALMLPEKTRVRFRTTNSLERLNQELKRRSDPIRIFPNSDSVIRIMGIILLEKHENWSIGRRYIRPENFFWLENSEPEDETNLEIPDEGANLKRTTYVA